MHNEAMVPGIAVRAGIGWRDATVPVRRCAGPQRCRSAGVMVEGVMVEKALMTSTTNSPPTPFHDLDHYVAYPRVSGLTLSPDGSRLVTTVSTVTPEGTGYASALWELDPIGSRQRSEEHTSELQSRGHLVCRLLLEKKKRPHN